MSERSEHHRMNQLLPQAIAASAYASAVGRRTDGVDASQQTVFFQGERDDRPV